MWLKALSESFWKDETLLTPPYSNLGSTPDGGWPRDVSAPREREASSPERTGIATGPSASSNCQGHRGRHLTNVTIPFLCVIQQLAPRPDPHLMLWCSSEMGRRRVGGPSMTPSMFAAEGLASSDHVDSSFLPGPGEVRKPGRAETIAPPLARLPDGRAGVVACRWTG